MPHRGEHPRHAVGLGDRMKGWVTSASRVRTINGAGSRRHELDLDATVRAIGRRGVLLWVSASFWNLGAVQLRPERFEVWIDTRARVMAKPRRSGHRAATKDSRIAAGLLADALAPAPPELGRRVGVRFDETRAEGLLRVEYDLHRTDEDVAWTGEPDLLSVHEKVAVEYSLEDSSVARVTRSRRIRGSGATIDAFTAARWHLERR